MTCDAYNDSYQYWNSEQMRVRFTHLRFETHIEHSIRLIENQISDPLKIDQSSRVRRQQLNHSSRCTNDDF